MDDIMLRIDKLKRSAGERYKINPGRCHYGHLALEGMLERPTAICQIDAATDTKESNISLALRSMRLASAMDNHGVKVADTLIIMSYNNLDMSVPFYASGYMGYALCCMDPAIGLDDVIKLFAVIKPKLIFCEKNNVQKNKDALQANHLEAHIVALDDKENDLEIFIQIYKGTEENFRPAIGFDTSSVPAMLMLTSGTTGTPKVAIITYDALLNAIKEWWVAVPERVNMNMIMISTQWLSSLIYMASSTIKPYIKLQSSKPVTLPLMLHMINDYKPSVTCWTPFLLAQFVQSPKKIADLSCFSHILIGGAPSEKPLIEAFKKICGAKLFLSYGMSELVGGVFDYDMATTPWSSVGKGIDSKYQYKLIDEDGKDTIKKPNTTGELWVKGNYFFKGYLGQPEETKKILTDDGWIQTGDIFYRDENNYFYFVDRKKQLIRYYGFWVSPLEIEEVIKLHPGVAEACVVPIKNPETIELAVGAILRKNGHKVEPQEIFNLVKSKLPEMKWLYGGLFFVEGFPMTASGKINRTKIIQMVENTTRIMPQ